MSTRALTAKETFTPRLCSPRDHLEVAPGYDSDAVARCCQAWNLTLEAASKKGINIVSCHLRANEAFRNAMPPLSSAKNIRDFIACTAFGMMANTIDYAFAPKLLYAAQMAHAAQRRATAGKHPASGKQAKAKKTRSSRGSAPRNKRKN